MLNQILAHTRQRVAEQAARVPLERLLESLPQQKEENRALSLAEAMRQREGMAVIAEIKRASPSKGLLAPDLDPVQLARSYLEAGASAISVLTEPSGFGGSTTDLLQVREAVACPLLRKDFILSPYQVAETAALGGDILLLIAAALSEEELANLHQAAASLHLQCLLEVHSEEELHRVLALPLDPHQDFIGINNRDLNTFQVSLETTFRLIRQVPDELMVISESGIRTRDQVKRLEEVGVKGILVGESLVTAADPASVLRMLKGEEG